MPNATAKHRNSRWSRYWRTREPVHVFTIAGHARKFIAYTVVAYVEVQALLRQQGTEVTYRLLCEDALRLGAEADILALPLDSPEWGCPGGLGCWRPLEVL